MKISLDIWPKAYREKEEGIRGEDFKRLLDLCFAHADSFSLSDQSPKEWKTCPDSVQDMLEPYLIRTKITPQWFGYFMTDPPLTVSVYRACEETKRIMGT